MTLTQGEEGDLRLVRPYRLYRLLGPATSLRVLRLRFLNGSPSKPTPALRAILGDISWPQLRDVELGIVRASEQDIVEFCSLHKHELRRLSLFEIELTSGSWPSVFRRLHTCLPKLQKIKLRGKCKNPNGTIDFNFDDPDSRNFARHEQRDAVEDYILNGGPFPNLKALGEADRYSSL